MRASVFILVYILTASSLSGCSSSAAAERPPARDLSDPAPQDGVVHLREAFRAFIGTEMVSGIKSGDSVTAPTRRAHGVETRVVQRVPTLRRMSEDVRSRKKPSSRLRV
jgi:hypothetical protein